MILFLLLAALSASTFTFGKEALLYTTPLFLIGFRLSIAGVLFLATYYFYHRSWPKLSASDWFLLAQISFFPYFIGFVCEFSALDYMPSWKVAFMYGLSPVVAALLSYVACNERLTILKLTGLAICLVGFIPEIIIKAPLEGSSIFYISFAEFLLFIAISAFVYGWILMRKMYRHSETSSLFINGAGMLGGGFFSLIGSLIQGIFNYNAANGYLFFPVTSWHFFMFAGTLIIIGNIMCTTLYTLLLKRYTASLVTFNELITPLFAAFYGWLFLNETVSWFFFPSLLTILVGMYLFYIEEKRQGNFS